MRNIPWQERFENKIERVTESGCWLWSGYVDKDGYGTFRYKGVSGVKAHRVSWEMANGCIPVMVGHDRVCVLHRCDVPGCVNPAHLFLGTNSDNMTDKKNKGRCNTPVGERNAWSKLSTEIVLEIRRLLDETDMTQKQVGEMLGVDRTTVGYVYRRDTWKHV